MNVADLQDSDSSDEDYIPNEKVDDVPSEIDEDDPISDEETNQKSKRKGKAANRLKRREIIKEEAKETNKAVNKEEKNNVDDLWADFIKDTGFKSKTDVKSNLAEPESDKPKQTKLNNSENSTVVTKNPHDKVKVTQIFEFAGEEVRVEKEVRADSAEARLLSEKQPSHSNSSKRSAGLSGIGSVLSQLSKKPKITTLEKTKLDWDSYKRDHSIEEELETHNKGKDGYLERQDFLQRTDLRRFEIEKSIRDVERSKRFNSTS
ncbi:unnamed protein product [Psylliodes chrysocephalus]|uniref:Craniofacial development protein 1 n=1 Tax=Psylliodes chrysocephalus TaxID=3402493 RepID=A0A9P0CKK0_9CUCU|nr:unnamed protein product [Psylliodes chrysocephala]